MHDYIVNYLKAYYQSFMDNLRYVNSALDAVDRQKSSYPFTVGARIVHSIEAQRGAVHVAPTRAASC